MKKLLLFTVAVLTAAVTFGQDCEKLFFSEYVEGSSQNKALEIYNPTGQTISLDGYRIERFSNGSLTMTNQLVFPLDNGTNEIAPYSTYVICHGRIEPDAQNGSVDSTLYFDIADAHSTGVYGNDPMFFNGNDAIALFNPQGLPIDLVGKIGQDPGKGWCDDPELDYQAGDSFWLSWTANHTMIRKSSVKYGVSANPEFFNPALEWDTVGIDVFSGLGSHVSECNLNGMNSNVEVAQINLFPNPVNPNGQFTVLASKHLAGIDIMNVIGQVVKTEVITDMGGKYTTNVSGMDSGLYLVRLSFTDNSNQVVRLTIQ